jgi:hypothetical protein
VFCACQIIIVRRLRGHEAHVDTLQLAIWSKDQYPGDPQVESPMEPVHPCHAFRRGDDPIGQEKPDGS